MKRLIGGVCLCLLLSASCLAEDNHSNWTTWQRVSGDQKVLTVAVSPDLPDGKASYFTAESLKEALPRLWPAHILKNWCEGKWQQRGVIVLESKEVIFWHSCEKDLIVFEGEKYFGSFGFRKEETSQSRALEAIR